MKGQGTMGIGSLGATLATRALHRVLVVDRSLKTIQRLAALRRNGYELIYASDRATALRELRDKRPDIVCLDLAVISDGYELARQIRNCAAGFGVLLVAFDEKRSLTIRGQTNDPNIDCFYHSPLMRIVCCASRINGANRGYFVL